MAPAWSKMLGADSSLASFMEKRVALAAGGLTVLVWLASVHQNNKNRRYRGPAPAGSSPGGRSRPSGRRTIGPGTRGAIHRQRIILERHTFYSYFMLIFSFNRFITGSLYGPQAMQRNHRGHSTELCGPTGRAAFERLGPIPGLEGVPCSQSVRQPLDWDLTLPNHGRIGKDGPEFK